MRQIKLIWDFRGPDAIKFAKHHAVHLKEYIAKDDYPIQLVDSEVKNETFAIAYMVVLEKDMMQFRDRLKPHRATVFQQI